MARPPLSPIGTGNGVKAHSELFPPLLSSLIAALPGPLLVLDRDDRVALASPAAEKMFGHPPHGLAGVDVLDLFPDGIRQSPTRGVRRCGERLRLEISLRQIRHDGEPLTLVWLENVTERRRSEDSLRRNVQDLERATRAKSDFVASVSHEIRTPMNAVLGMTDILLESDLDDQQRELAQRVRRAGVNLMRTLNDVLDLSKVEAGRLDLEPRSFALRAWLHEAVELFHTQAETKGLALEALVDPDVPEMVHGDAPRLRQVLVNLIGNAVKFTAAGRVTVAVHISCETGDLVFEVRDTGVGIAPDLLERLFEPYAQAGSSTAREYGGTGLGLAIARRLVERMGGTIEAGGNPGGGSAFRFRVPLGSKKSAHREPFSVESAQPRPPARRLA